MKIFLASLCIWLGISKLPSWPTPSADSQKMNSSIYRAKDTVRNPSVVLEEKWVDPMKILLIKDTAATESDLAPIFTRDFGELFGFVNKNRLKPMKMMAFYHTEKFPFVIDIAAEVDEIPDQLAGRIKSTKTEGGNAVIAHFQGPYSQMRMAYDSINDWLKKQNKLGTGAPFEVYLNSPAMVKDSTELRTDVYRMIK